MSHHPRGQKFISVRISFSNNNPVLVILWANHSSGCWLVASPSKLLFNLFSKATEFWLLVRDANSNFLPRLPIEATSCAQWYCPALGSLICLSLTLSPLGLSRGTYYRLTVTGQPLSFGWNTVLCLTLRNFCDFVS